ncbi:hypothetical protein PsYK624_171580 [Phanerochaete sordida]|uniref:Uncharacterized protein n=1 Tax=Phanerochaete sordida TaxID=48140 RepID=A0A9P3LMZ6_9APHY|nr:hypothetical protein PsYK624_171580 [Phanerochaete sordida]
MLCWHALEAIKAPGDLPRGPSTLAIVVPGTLDDPSTTLHVNAKFYIASLTYVVGCPIVTARATYDRSCFLG